MGTLYRLAGIAALGLLAACQSSPTRLEQLDRMQEVLKEGEQQPAPRVPPEVSAALIPSLRLDAPGGDEAPDGQRFDVAVNNVPADQFFMSLVDGTPYNMVVHPEVSGHITLNLRGVTIPDVLAAARDVYGFEFQRTRYGYQILPARLEARVYQIDYLNIARSGSSSTFVSAGTLQEAPGAEQLGAESDTDADASSSRRGQRTVVGTQISTILPETSFWAELQASLVAIVGGGQGRGVVVNPQSGVVVVRAIPTELREVEAFLQATQLIAQRQVILEAKILEVELGEGFQSGINWSAIIGDFTLTQTGGGQNLLNESGFSDLAGAPIPLVPGQNTLPSPLASAFGGVFSLAVDTNEFAGFIELLETQGNVHVLSSPRISTMNNQKAIIKVGTDEFFVTDVSTTTITGTATTSTPNIELTPFFSGIALDVTPQISEQNAITLHIHPSVSQVSDQQKNITIGGINQTLPLARSTVRESDSIVRAHSGQLVVIGGLMQDRVVGATAGMPGLGKLPLVGSAFRHDRRQSIKSELVILLKPVVIDTPQRWGDAFRATSASLERLRQDLHQRADQN